MLNVNKNGALEAPLFSEGSAGRFKIKIQGTAFNNAGPRQLFINGVARYDQATNRGLRLTVMDYNLVNTFDTVYDVYGSTAACDAMATKLTEVMATANVLFVITSYDGISTNANLQTAMANARSTEFKKVTTYGRFPYAAFGSSKHGILKEVLYGDLATYPKAVIETAFESINNLGRTGYGPLLCNEIDVRSATSGYNFYGKLLGYVGSGPDDIWADEYIWLKCQARVSPDRAAAGGKVAPYIYSYTDANEWGRAVSVAISDTEWVDVNLFLRRDDAWRHGTSGKPENKFYVGLYHYPSGNAVGKSEIRNLTVVRAGVGPTSTEAISRVIVSDHILSARDISDGLPFDAYSRDSYYELYNSPDNLYKGSMPADMLNGGAVADEVNLLTRVLPNADCTRCIKELTDTTNENTQFVLPTVLIKPDTPYFASIWVKSFTKTAGSLYFGMHTFNSSVTQVGSLRRDTAVADANQYFNIQNTAQATASGVLGEWKLMVGIILPESWTAEQVAAFISPAMTGNSLFDGILTPPINGGYGYFKLANATDRMRLRFLDYYNASAKTKSHWALPILIPLNTLRMSKRDGLVAYKLKEV